MRKRKISKVEYLTNASNSAVSIVRSLLESLQKVNEEITTEQSINAEKIAQIQADNETLDKLRESNDKVISNFTALLS